MSKFAAVMVVVRQLGRAAAILGILVLLPAVSRAAVQTLVASGVSSLIDNVPSLGDPTLLWTTTPACNPPGPRIAGMPGDELQPALISRASLSIATPRAIFSFNPTRPVAACNPYRLLSNVFAFGNDLYFIDNQGPGGSAALRRLRRDANPSDAPQLLADLGTINGGRLIVFGVSVIIILGDDVSDRIVQYHKDTGDLINGHVEFPADRGTLGHLDFDGRFLYWTNRGALRRNDTTNGSLETVLNGPITALYTDGYTEQCDPKGCEQLSRIIFAQDNNLYEAETIYGQVFPVYTSPVANARITAIERGPIHYYFIERRPVGGGFARDDRFFRLGVGDTVPDLIYGPINNGGPGFDGLRTDFTWLYFNDRANESLLRLSNFEAAIPVRDLRATGLEITQGLQNAANSLRLIAEKRTIVRFYTRSGLAEDVFGVTASLAGSNQNGFLGRLEPVNAGGKLITVRQSPTRTNLDHSFQFELPRHWTTGGRLSLTATVNPFERIIEGTLADNSASTQVDFTASPRLLVVYYNWAYDLGGARRTPVATDVAASRRRLRRLYPVGEPGDAFESPGLHTVVLDFVDNQLTDQVDRTDADCVKRYKKAADRNMCASDYVHGRMAMLRQGSGIAPDTVSYANIAQAPAPMGLNYFTRGYANGQFASGPSSDVNYAAHEVGHTLQRAHPTRGALKCGHSASDNNYPYGGAFIAETGPDTETRYAGLDFDDKLGAMTYLDADSQFDTMAYCTPNWISDYTFEGMYQYLISDTRPRAALAGPRGPVLGDWLMVSGTMIPAEGEGGFVVVQRATSVMDATAPEPGGFTLELRNSAGGVLASHPFAANPVEEREGKLVFAFVVPFIPGTAELRVMDALTDEVLATHAVSASVPLVSDVQLPGATNPVDGIVTVTWNASDADGDELRFDLFASRNGDPMYRPIQLGIAENTVSLDTSMLGGGTNKLRVVASDGTNTAYAESAAFTVPARAPKVVITSPVDGFQADWGQLVTLQAEVDDVQDELVSEVYWSSSKSGEFATGRWAQTDQLPVGENVIEVTAVNSLGESASATVTVHVGDVLVPPGPTLSVAPQAIAWHVAGDDATTQVAMLEIDNHGAGTLDLNIRSDASWLLIDNASAVGDAVAPRVFTITAEPSMVRLGATSHATLTLENAADANDVVTVAVELSRGNVFDHTGDEPVCTGDCDDSGAVGIAELIRAVNIALGNLVVGDCAAVDFDADGEVGVNELILAVGRALRGC